MPKFTRTKLYVRTHPVATLVIVAAFTAAIIHEKKVYEGARAETAAANAEYFASLTD